MIFSHCPLCLQPLKEWEPNVPGRITNDLYCAHDLEIQSMLTLSFHLHKGNLIHFNYQFNCFDATSKVSLYANQWDSRIYLGRYEITKHLIDLDDIDWSYWDLSNESNLQKQIQTILTFH